MILGKTNYLQLEHSDIGRVETIETSTLCVETRHISVLAAEGMSVLATEEMSVVATKQLSSVETGQISVVET